MHHVQMLKEQPSPSDLRQSALNSFNSMMNDFEIEPYRQTLLRGLMMNYAECERLIAEDSTTRTPKFPNTVLDHELTAIKDAIS